MLHKPRRIQRQNQTITAALNRFNNCKIIGLQPEKSHEKQKHVVNDAGWKAISINTISRQARKIGTV